jgi:gluconate 2-dehydrogenase gamma chain
MRLSMKSKELTSRRTFLLRAAVPVAGATILGVTRHGVASASKAGRTYKPSYFNADEWAFVSAAVDRLIPADEAGPGGADAGIPEFIDRQLEMPYGHGAYAYMRGPFNRICPRRLDTNCLYAESLYRHGIAAASRRAARCMGGREAVNAQRIRSSACWRGTHREGDPPLAAFFAQLLENTREGFFADPIYGGNRGMGGWKLIGFPGARADFTDWIDQAGRPYPYGPVSIDGERA